MVLVPVNNLPKSSGLNQPTGSPQSQIRPLIHMVNDALPSIPDDEKEQTLEDISPHTCRHCSRITIDMRQNSKDGKIDGQIGFTVDDVDPALKNDCALFSAFHEGAYLVRMTSGPDNPIWVERTLKQPAMVSFHEMDSERLKLGYTMTNRLGEFVLYSVPGQKAHELFGSQPPPNILPNSELSFSRARKYLDECSANHARCRDFNLKHMPTHLLEILSNSTITTSSPFPSFRVRLVTNPSLAPYAALSYCWGGDQPGKTTKKNLPLYSRDIPLDVIPLTIIDALTVTHGVGMKYLWVDALCIIQDSDQDKMSEISNMHRIYRGAFLTIAAGVAGTSLDGFLRPRVHDCGYILNVRVDSKVDDKNGETIQVIAVPIRSRRDQEILPLYTRAWTFQEGQLSTRVLAYVNRGMVFHCLESRHTDGGHEQPIETLRSVDDAISAGFKYLDPGNQSLMGVKHPLAWGVIVEAYTSRALTVGDDKLLAVMAIAEEYKRTNKGVVGEYLAGLWRGEMLFQLLWAGHKASDVKTKFKRPENYRAPSWSWASLDGHFRMYLHQGVLDGSIEYKYVCELLHAETTLVGDNPLGQVMGGFIRLRGRVKKVVWRRNGTGRRDYGYGWALGDSESKWVRPKEMPGDNRLSWYIDIPDEWPVKQDIVMSCVEVCTYEAPENLMQIAMVQLYDERGGSPNMTQGRGILLVSVEGQLGTYRRVGTMGCKGYLKGDVCFEKNPYWFDEGQSAVQEIVVI
ncbi:heterokaryon incompatibility protein-domain-containing protein [Triangularia setosa]|uniref:Heterokaryon incompatibility protein-domain-containing protein n=1 Tax=Triangularia setosa TaxID=2587417 RepID=A0AAN6W4Y0_9PEZI|nr:heterokaryon incompatibility protein-domain-containing protein [Podospora setosa]